MERELGKRPVTLLVILDEAAKLTGWRRDAVHDLQVVYAEPVTLQGAFLEELRAAVRRG